MAMKEAASRGENSGPADRDVVASAAVVVLGREDSDPGKPDPMILLGAVYIGTTS